MWDRKQRLSISIDIFHIDFKALLKRMLSLIYASLVFDGMLTNVSMTCKLLILLLCEAGVVSK